MSDRLAMFGSGQFVLQGLIDEGFIGEDDRRRVVEHAARTRGELVQSVLALSLVTPRQLALVQASIVEYPFVELSHYDVGIENARLMPRRLAERAGAFPLFVTGGVATVAMVDPLNLQHLDKIRQALRTDVDPVICDEQELRAMIARAYSLAETHAGFGSAHEDSTDLTTGEEPIVAAVNQILVAGVELGASDVHLSPEEGEVQLRYRVDGVLQQKAGPSIAVHAAMIQRLKVMAKLDVTQTRRPQDGKFRFVHGGERVDVRLSVVPTLHGENAVLRLLRPSSTLGSVSDLGMTAAVAAEFTGYIERPNGIVLVTGPTGSGKTTTLYTALSRLNSPERNIVTIEDPVEIRLPGVRQVQVNADVGLTFASTLRSVLRQDPDVVLVGEIRDGETARIAMQAAMTGHLVFSTLHTNDAVSSVARLKDLGVPAFAINDAMLCVVAQRLARRVCESCAEPVAPDRNRLLALGIDPGSRGNFVSGRGCQRCMNHGFRGRIGIYELFGMSAAVQGLVESGVSSAELRRAAIESGMVPLLHDGLQKAQLGLTTVEELSKLRAVLDIEASSSGPGGPGGPGGSGGPGAAAGSGEGGDQQYRMIA